MKTALLQLALPGLALLELLLFMAARPSSAQISLVQDACLTRAIVTMPSTHITVDATAGGVQVLAANQNRCSALIQNAGAAPMSCAPSTVTPSPTSGIIIGAGQSFPLTLEGRASWKCLRTTATSTTAAVVEAAVP